jgi:diguanylate cyclase (GGDEF)-like protein/PAS domain S-box-containing protein
MTDAARLAAIVESSDLAIMQTDLSGRILSANAAVYAVFGFEPHRLVGQNVAMIIPADERETTANAMAMVAAGGTCHALTTRRVRSDGSAFDACTQLSPVRDNAGNIVGISGITRDVTAEVLTQLQLAASERVFRARFECADMPQAMLDLDSKLVRVNDALSRLLGRDRSELEGRSFSDFRHPSDTGDGRQLARIVGGGSEAETWERILCRPDGTAVAVVVQASLVRGVDDDPSSIVCFMQDVSSLQQARLALSQREAMFDSLVRRAAELALLIDPAGTILYVSPSASALAAARGYDLEAIVGRNRWEFYHPDDLARAKQIFDEVVSAPGSTQMALLRAINPVGEWVWVEETLTNCLDDPDIAAIVSNSRDVTTRVEAEQALRLSEARYRGIVDTAQEGILVVKADFTILYANQKLAQILDIPVELIYQTPAADVLGAENRELIVAKSSTRRTRGAEQYELPYVHPDGYERILRLSVSPLRDDTGAGSLVMITDVTEERRVQRELQRRALHDDLTGLANRSLLNDRLDRALSRSRSANNVPVAALVVKLDKFNLINDSWGHDAGDRLLIAAAERLSSSARPGDTVARLGGEEFAIVCEDVDPAAAHELAAQVLGALSAPFQVAGQRTFISASIGIAVSPPCVGEELLRGANAAMLVAQARGHGRAELFNPLSVDDDTRDRLTLSNDLRDALANDELMLHYQPLVNLTTGRIVGVEALARWNHPVRGPVSPMVFVAVAEATGLAPTLDRWALERACSDLRLLREIVDGALRVSVNLSASHLADDDLEDTVVLALRDHGLTGDELELEITESAIMDNPDKARTLLQRLRSRGITVAIDDFGTGYSSLGYLARLPATTLKIDRGFVMGINDDPTAVAIVASIIDLGRAMQLTTIGEGIETVDQLRVLRHLGCNVGQGYLFSPALSLEELANKVNQLPRGRFPIATAAVVDVPA